MTTATETKERPILFSGPMIRAILAGRKTQTRRVIKPQIEEYEEGPLVHKRRHAGPYYDAYNGGPGWCWWTSDDRQGTGWRKCPYGVPGDRLWVREKFSPYLYRDGCWYWADGNAAQYDATIPKPSIHMPRWASRITLEVKSVRVERLQEIGEGDAEAEGAAHRITGDGDLAGAFAHIEGPVSYVAHFKGLWDRINDKRGFGWDTNPWVWVVEFRKCEPAK